MTALAPVYRHTPRRLAAALVALALLAPAATDAHFQELIPSVDILPDGAPKSLSLALAFTHPMERGPVMEMAAPKRFGVMADGRKTDLSKSLKATKIDGKTAFTADYAVSEPGNYIFYVEPAPYWEPAEGKYIIHYTKVIVDYAGGEGWDQLVGLPVEIEPLVRPYGVWTHNLFRGIVRKNGKPVPFAEVEVEWRNDGSVKAPADAFVTQVIKADGAGVFSYAMPRAGWWGFAALTEGDAKMKSPQGKAVPVELGALIWVKATDMR